MSRGGGGVTLILSHIRRLRLFLGVQNSEFQYFFLGGFQKNENCLGYEDCVFFFLFFFFVFFCGGGGGGGVITKMG